jgi:hypothetical protein
VDTEGAHQVPNVVSHRLRAQVELLCDLLGRAPVLKKVQNLGLPRR